MAMLLRLGTEQDLPQIVALIHEILPAMHEAGNFQWDAKYPLETDFRKDVVNSPLWVAEIEGEIAGVAGKRDVLSPP